MPTSWAKPASSSGSIPSRASWSPLTLANGWRNWDAANPGDAAIFEGAFFAVSGGAVFMRGLIDGNLQTSQDLGSLPAEARPARRRRVVVQTSGGAATLTISSDGVVRIESGALTFVYLDTCFAL